MQPQYVFTNAWYFAGQLLSPCRSLVLPLKFGLPALQTLAVLYFIGTPYVCCFVWLRSQEVWEETAVVDTGVLAASRKQSLTKISFVPPVHYAQLNISGQRFKHWEVNTFDIQFIFLHASRVVGFRCVCGKGRQWVVTGRTNWRQWVTGLGDYRDVAWRGVLRCGESNGETGGSLGLTVLSSTALAVLLMIDGTEQNPGLVMEGENNVRLLRTGCGRNRN